MLMGEYLKRERKLRKITMVQLAEKTGVAQSSISDIENCKQRNPSNIDAILKALGLTWEDAKKAGVDFYGEGAAIEVSYQSDFEYCMNWLKKMSKNEISNLRIILEHQDRLKNGGNNDESEEDDSGI